MVQFILTYLALISFGVLLVLVARSWPRIKDESPEAQGRFTRWLITEMPHEADAFLDRWVEKLFRRLKVIVLRIDNFLTERLRSANLKATAKPKIDFKEIENTAEMTAPPSDGRAKQG